MRRGPAILQGVRLLVYNKADIFFIHTRLGRKWLRARISRVGRFPEFPRGTRCSSFLSPSVNGQIPAAVRATKDAGVAHSTTCGSFHYLEVVLARNF